MARIPLHNILEELFGIGKINTKKGMDQLLEALDELPDDMVIDFGKYTEGASDPNS